MAINVRTVNSPAATYVRDQSYFDAYCNQVRLSMSVSDFGVILGITDDRGPGTVVVKDLGIVRLAPVTLKVLTVHLTAAVEAYERALGVIDGGKAASPSVVNPVKEQLYTSLMNQSGRPPPEKG